MKPLIKLANVLSPGCKQAARLQSEGMDRKLPFAEQLGLRLHLFLCKWCRRYGQQLKFLRSAAHECEAHQDPELPAKLSPEARQRIKEKLRGGS